MKVGFGLICLWIGLWTGSARANYGVYLGSHFGFGRMGDESAGQNQLRTMGTFDLQAMPGFRVLDNSVLTGLMLDLRFMGQLSGDQSLQPFGGKGLLLGPGVSYETSVLKFLLAWDIRARHSVSEPETTFQGSGIHLIFSYKMFEGIAADFEFVRVRYNSVTVNGLETGLAETSEVVHKNFGFGLSYNY